jgi:uncharacterized protein with ATP-grasp and redox domains
VDTLVYESAENALDQAIVTRLKDVITDDNTKYVPIFTQIPKGEVFPYIKVGEKFSNDSFRTKTSYGESVMVRIHAFSQTQGTKEINNITSQIKAAIGGNYLDLSAAGFNNVVMNMSQSRIFQDEAGGSDFGYTHHAVIEIEFKIQKT